MSGEILIGIAAFAPLPLIALRAAFAAPNSQEESTTLDFLIAVIEDADDKGLFPDALSAALSDWFIENLIAPDTGETPAQVRERLTTTPVLAVVDAPAVSDEFGIINIAITDVPPGVGLGSARLTDSMHYWGVGEVTMKFVAPGVVAPMLASEWELDLDMGSPVGATLKIRDDVIFHGEGLGDRSNNGGSWGTMTAEDIAFTINDGNGAVNTASIHWQAGDFATVLGDNEAVAVDANTLSITFATDAAGNTLYDPRWNANLFNDAAQAFSVQSHSEPLQHRRRDAEMKDTNFIGTGPLHVVEWIQDDTAILEAVPYDH